MLKKVESNWKEKFSHLTLASSLNLEALRTEYEDIDPDNKKKLSKQVEEPFQLLEKDEDPLFECFMLK